VKNYTVRTYEPSDYAQWNAFVSKAKNATFLFHRDFMEYHSDRFFDFSMLVFEGEKLLSILPANREGAVVFSHQGLSYGGFVFDSDIKLGKAINVFREMLLFLNKSGVSFLELKPVPFFYHDFLSEEIEYALFLTEAQRIRSDCFCAIDMSKPYSYTENKKRKVKRGKSHAFSVVETNNFSGFWNEVLIPNLEDKHQVSPVHNLEEIALLKQRFPNNIRQFNVLYNGKIVAGTTIFETKNVAHAQYISGIPEFNTMGSIDFLFDHLLQQVYREKPFFDFGISNENAGKNLNEGLLYWKESFGARIAMQHFYKIDTSNYTLLENVYI